MDSEQRFDTAHAEVLLQERARARVLPVRERPERGVGVERRLAQARLDLT